MVFIFFGREFGLKIRTHPGVLKITAANKFRYKKIMYLSYSGELEQTYQFKLDKNKFKINFDRWCWAYSVRRRTQTDG